jgi:hypothetical protein
MNLLNSKDLNDKAAECDRKALLAKRVELRNAFMDLGEQYRPLAWKVKASQQKQGTSAMRPLWKRLLATVLAERI